MTIETTPGNTVTVRNLNALHIATIAMIILLAGLIYITHWRLQVVEEQLAMTPPLVVIDFAELVSSYGFVEGPELEAKMVEARDKVQKLKDAGYLVLDAANVVAAPADVYLPVDIQE